MHRHHGDDVLRIRWAREKIHIREIGAWAVDRRGRILICTDRMAHERHEGTNGYERRDDAPRTETSHGRWVTPEGGSKPRERHTRLVGIHGMEPGVERECSLQPALCLLPAPEV